MAPFQRISVWFRGLENKKALAIAAMPAGQEYSKEVTGGASVALGRQQETWGVGGGVGRLLDGRPRVKAGCLGWWQTAGPALGSPYLRDPEQRREGTTTQHRHTQHKNTHNKVK